LNKVRLSNGIHVTASLSDARLAHSRFNEKETTKSRLLNTLLSLGSSQTRTLLNDATVFKLDKVIKIACQMSA